MTDAIRAARARLPNVLAGSAPANAGLLLDRYLPATGDDNAALRQLLDRVCNAPPDALYSAAYRRWVGHQSAMPNVALQCFRVQGRVIVGLGGASVHETAITLHRA